MRPFDLKKAKEGANLCTIDGRKVIILSFESSAVPHHPIAGRVEGKSEELYWNLGGHNWYNSAARLDLFLADDEFDWTNYRREVAMRMMPSQEVGSSKIHSWEDKASLAVAAADALIEALKARESHDDTRD